MTAKEVLEVLEDVGYIEVLKVLVMYETGQTEEFAEAVVDKFMADDNCTTIWDLKEHI